MKIVTTITLLLFYTGALAQEHLIKAEILLLEEQHVQAILQKDTTTLRKIWPQNFMVNSPRNMVAIGGQIERVMQGSLAYSSYIFKMEEMLIKGDMVITMGNETVVPVMGNPKGGQTIKRRYTHIWIKENDTWILTARHASEICF